MNDQRDTYTVTEAARILGVCRATVRRYINRRWLEAERLPSGHHRVRASALLALKLRMQQGEDDVGR